MNRDHAIPLPNACQGCGTQFRNSAPNPCPCCGHVETPFRYVPPPKTCAPKPKPRHGAAKLAAALIAGTFLVILGAVAGIKLFG